MVVSAKCIQVIRLYTVKYRSRRESVEHLDDPERHSESYAPAAKY